MQRSRCNSKPLFSAKSYPGGTPRVRTTAGPTPAQGRAGAGPETEKRMASKTVGEFDLTALGWVVLLALIMLMLYLGNQSSVRMQDETAGPQSDVHIFQGS